LIKTVLHSIVVTICLSLSKFSFAQTDTNRLVPIDTLVKKADPNIQNERKVDSVLRVHSPKKAALRSAILPGWGQAYNKRYWKIPIVYTALGITGYVFFYNLDTYRDLRFAYRAKYLASLPAGQGRDSSLLPKIKPRYQPYSAEDIRYYRDEFRRNIDYSALIFIVFWGLNIVDAAVDAHLRSFDVSPDLSFRFKAGYSEMAQTNGVSLILVFK
jgi:hypothetical protein